MGCGAAHRNTGSSSLIATSQVCGTAAGVTDHRNASAYGPACGGRAVKAEPAANAGPAAPPCGAALNLIRLNSATEDAETQRFGTAVNWPVTAAS